MSTVFGEGLENSSDMSVFAGLMQTTLNIEQNLAESPAHDLEYHQLALDGIRRNAREHLSAHPDVIDFYRKAGSWAASTTVECLEQDIRSSEQLLAYVQAGLLDTLTIAELEDRLSTLRTRLQSLPYIEAVQRTFGDLLEVQDDYDTAPSAKVANQPPRVVDSPEPQLNDSSAESLDNNIERVRFLMQSNDFSLAMQEFVALSLVGETQLPYIRDESPAIAALDEKEYQQFKSHLKTERERVIEVLTDNEIAARWELLGAVRRGRKYHLTLGEAATTQTDSPENLPARSNATRSKLDETKLEQFQNELYRVVKSVVSSGLEYTAKQTYVSARVAEWLDITKDQASQLIDGLISNNLLTVTGVRNGSPVLEVRSIPLDDKPAPRKARQMRSRASKKESKAPRGMFFADEVQLAEQVCQIVSQTGTYDRGVLVAKIESDLGVKPGSMRSFVERLHQAGVCKAEKVRDPESASGKNTQTFSIKFPSRGAWSRFQSDPADYLHILPVAQ